MRTAIILHNARNDRENKLLEMVDIYDKTGYVSDDDIEIIN